MHGHLHSEPSSDRTDRGALARQGSGAAEDSGMARRWGSSHGRGTLAVYHLSNTQYVFTTWLLGFTNAMIFRDAKKNIIKSRGLLIRGGDYSYGRVTILAVCHLGKQILGISKKLWFSGNILGLSENILLFFLNAWFFAKIVNCHDSNFPV